MVVCDDGDCEGTEGVRCRGDGAAGRGWVSVEVEVRVKEEVGGAVRSRNLCSQKTLVVAPLQRVTPGTFTHQPTSDILLGAETLSVGASSSLRCPLEAPFHTHETLPPLGGCHQGGFAGGLEFASSTRYGNACSSEGSLSPVEQGNCLYPILVTFVGICSLVELRCVHSPRAVLSWPFY